MSKTITREQWDSLRYPIVVHQLSEEEGGGWLASIPMLGQAAFMADAETAEAAVKAVEDLRRDLYTDVIASGQPIPIPQDVTDEMKLPSGKWVMRTPACLHAELQEAAKANGVSFNAYCNLALERGHTVLSMKQVLHEIAGQIAQTAAREITSRHIVHDVTLKGEAPYKIQYRSRAYTPNISLQDYSSASELEQVA